jgi:hypothetical protein
MIEEDMAMQMDRQEGNDRDGDAVSPPNSFDDALRYPYFLLVSMSGQK